MGKLREDITLKEASAWTKDFYDGAARLSTLGFRVRYGGDSNYPSSGYPESFYEQPPIGSFGKFWDEPKRLYSTKWGELENVKMTIPHSYCREEDGCWFANFTPGLPQDVDADGYPKETS